MATAPTDTCRTTTLPVPMMLPSPARYARSKSDVKLDIPVYWVAGSRVYRSRGAKLRVRKTLSIMALTLLVATPAIGYSSNSLPTADTSLAACAAVLSSIEIQPKRVSVDEAVSIQGRDFARVVECNDTNMGFSCQEQGTQIEAMHDVSIDLVQDSRSWRLATVEPSQESYTFNEKLRLPDDVTPGKATVIAEGNYEPVRSPISVVK